MLPHTTNAILLRGKLVFVKNSLPNTPSLIPNSGVLIKLLQQWPRHKHRKSQLLLYFPWQQHSDADEQVSAPCIMHWQASTSASTLFTSIAAANNFLFPCILASTTAVLSHDSFFLYCCGLINCAGRIPAHDPLVGDTAAAAAAFLGFLATTPNLTVVAMENA